MRGRQAKETKPAKTTLTAVETAPNVYFMHFTNGGNNCQPERGARALSDADENRNENINLSSLHFLFFPFHFVCKGANCNKR